MTQQLLGLDADPSMNAATKVTNNTDVDVGAIAENADVDDDVITELDISHLTVEDDTPVDNFQSA